MRFNVVFLCAIAVPLFSNTTNAAGERDFLDAFHAKLAALIESDNDLARKYISESVSDCVPEPAKPYWTKENVKRAGIDAYVAAYGLMTPERSKAQRSKEFQEWATARYYRLPEADRNDFSRLMKSGFYGAETTFCISKKLYTKL